MFLNGEYLESFPGFAVESNLACRATLSEFQLLYNTSIKEFLPCDSAAILGDINFSFKAGFSGLWPKRERITEVSENFKL